MKARYKQSILNDLPKSLTVTNLSTRLIELDPTLKQDLEGLTTDHLLRAHHSIRSLLLSLPNHIEEVRARSGSSSLFTIRVVLFTLVDHNLLTLEEADQLAPLFRIIGLGSLEAALMNWFCQEHTNLGKTGWEEDEGLKLTTNRLERGLSILFHSDQGQYLFESLKEEERVRLSGPWVRPMMRLASYEVFPQYALCALFKSTSENMKATLIIQFEKCRRKVRAKPLPIYEKLIGDLTFDQLDLLFAYLASVGDLDHLESALPRLPLRIKVAYDKTRRLIDEVS